MAPGSARLAAVFAAALAASPLAAADWPGWRGPNRDGVALEPLPAAFPSQPAPRWRVPAGHGYASPVVAAGHVVLLEMADGHEVARALDPATGKERWRTPFAPAWSDEFEPGPRCTPLVDRGLVFVQSARGVLACLALADGKERWHVDFADLGMKWVADRQSNYGAAVRRGHTGSPVVSGDRLVAQVGATNGASIVAFGRADGRVLWKALDDATCYASPLLARLAGREQFVAATAEGLVGLDPAAGTTLWRVPFRTGANRNVLTPVAAGDSIVFSSHTTGMRRVALAAADGCVTATEQWFNRSLRVNLSTPVLAGGFLYGLGAAHDLVCVDVADGKPRWSEPGFGEVAQVIASGDRLLVQLDTGEVRLLRANPARYEELGRFQACGKTYSLPAWSDGVLYVRDPSGCAAYPLLAK